MTTLVSGIMPTKGRHVWACRALDSFLSQDYPDKELIVLDDARDPSFPEGITHDRVLYVVDTDNLNIPQKLNRCGAMASGEIIARFDSDDWSAPNRLSVQLTLLQESGLSVTGFNFMLFYDVSDGKSYQYTSVRNYACGTSLMYRRAWWQAHPFENGKAVASDNPFVREASQAKQLATMEGLGLIVARIHADNTSKKRPWLFRPYPDPLPEGFIP